MHDEGALTRGGREAELYKEDRVVYCTALQIAWQLHVPRLVCVGGCPMDSGRCRQVVEWSW